MRKIIQKLREESFVNSWTKNEHESSLMWDAYIRREGVAIKSSIGSIKKAFQASNKKIYMREISYIDKKDSAQHEGYNLNTIWFLFTKRKFFEEEKEVRLVCIDNDKPQKLDIDIDINSLIEEIHLAPSINDEVQKGVIEICGKCNLSNKIKESEITNY